MSGDLDRLRAMIEEKNAALEAVERNSSASQVKLCLFFLLSRHCLFANALMSVVGAAERVHCSNRPLAASTGC